MSFYYDASFGSNPQGNPYMVNPTEPVNPTLPLNSSASFNPNTSPTGIWKRMKVNGSSNEESSPFAQTHQYVEALLELKSAESSSKAPPKAQQEEPTFEGVKNKKKRKKVDKDEDFQIQPESTESQLNWAQQYVINDSLKIVSELTRKVQLSTQMGTADHKTVSRDVHIMARQLERIAVILSKPN